MSVLSGTLGSERVRCRYLGASQIKNVLTDFLFDFLFQGFPCLAKVHSRNQLQNRQ